MAKSLATHFQGLTIYPVAAGCWVGQDNQLNCDQNIVVEAVRPNTSAQQIAQDTAYMAQVASDLGKEFGQEAIFNQVDRDTTTEFVPGVYQKQLPPSMLDTRRPHRDPEMVFKDLLP
ncbi:MAG: hypothetical protein C7B46_12735 [Sulfobacillus benefaciens]|uniref:Uncharacterized protein n=1 Tax=Sulfobacillus benefaciens TaxID=453960 RepID=A0A2T2XE94_9FIRM|nr:MAG: hypothetical protein C7B46_12735 [Sulfobacillus benefaciens]